MKRLKYFRISPRKVSVDIPDSLKIRKSFVEWITPILNLIAFVWIGIITVNINQRSVENSELLAKMQTRPFKLEISATHISIVNLPKVKNDPNYFINVTSNFWNDTPAYGSLTELILVLQNVENKDENYICGFRNFFDPEFNENNPLVPRFKLDILNSLPVNFKPWERYSKGLTFMPKDLLKEGKYQVSLIGNLNYKEEQEQFFKKSIVIDSAILNKCINKPGESILTKLESYHKQIPIGLVTNDSLVKRINIMEEK